MTQVSTGMVSDPQNKFPPSLPVIISPKQGTGSLALSNDSSIDESLVNKSQTSPLSHEPAPDGDVNIRIWELL